MGTCRGDWRRAAPADAARPLGRRGQHHQGVGKYRKAATEVKLAEPYRIEPDSVAELYLREDVLIALMLGISRRTRQLVEEPETHESSPKSHIGDPITRPALGRQAANPAWRNGIVIARSAATKQSR